MKPKNLTGISITGIILLILLTGCGTIGAMFNGSHDVYMEGQNAWNKDKNGSLALLRMAETMDIDSEYEAPRDFLIKNYKEAITAVEKQLSVMKKDNYKDLKKRSDIYKDLAAFYDYVTDGTVVNPVVLGDKVLLIDIVDYKADINATATLVVAEGMKEGKDLISAGDFNEAKGIFNTLINEFLEGDEEASKRIEIASAFALKAQELSKSSRMDDIELGFSAVELGSDYDGNIPELGSAIEKLNTKKAQILLSEAKTLISKKDADSLEKAYNIYQKVIKIFPENQSYKDEAAALKTDIADSYYNTASRLERSFDGKRSTYDEIIAVYNKADGWIADYNGLRAKRDAFQKSAVIEIFVAVRHSGDDNNLQRDFAESLAAALPTDRMFEVVSLNSSEGRELANQIDMGSIPMGLAESYGFEYIVIVDNFRNGSPQNKRESEVKHIKSDYISKNGRIRAMSESDSSSWSFSATLTGDTGKNLTPANTSREFSNYMESEGVDEIWFDVNHSETYEKKWLEGRIDYSLSFYDTTSRRNWSQALTAVARTSANSGLTRLTSDAAPHRLWAYLLEKKARVTVNDPDLSLWDSALQKATKNIFESDTLTSAVISNIK